MPKPIKPQNATEPAVSRSKVEARTRRGQSEERSRHIWKLRRTVAVLTINTNQGVADVESALARLTECGAETDLLLSTNIKNPPFGGLISLVQLVITWRRRCPKSSLLTHVQPGDQMETQLENLAKSDHGLIALLLAYRVLDRKGETDLMARSLPLVITRLQKMDKASEAMRGPKFFLCVADDYPDQVSKVLYPHGRSPVVTNPVPIDGFEELSSAILDRFVKGGKRAKFKEIFTGCVARILNELFSNTHFWAQTDELGARLSSSVRGIRAELHTENIETHLDLTTDTRMLHDYLEHPKIKIDGKRQSFIEIDVFDSGPGLAARRLLDVRAEDSPSIREEFLAVRDCVATHYSSSAEFHRGQGLDLVLNTLTQLNGFLRIRTGRLSLARDFVSMPYSRSRKGVEPKLLDWKTGSADPTELASSEGTVYSFLIPVPNAD